jgi:hypothetical protein
MYSTCDRIDSAVQFASHDLFFCPALYIMIINNAHDLFVRLSMRLPSDIDYPCQDDSPVAWPGRAAREPYARLPACYY